MQNENPIDKLERLEKETWERNNEAFQERMRQDEQTKHDREMQTIGRMNASGLSGDGYAIRQLLDASLRGEVEIEEIHISDLGYSMDIHKWRDINALFDKLVEEGCIQSFERKINEWIKVTGLNTKRLKKKIKEYHPSHGDPSSRRRIIFESIAAIAAIFAIFGVVGAFYFEHRGVSEVQSLNTRIQALEEQKLLKTITEQQVEKVDRESVSKNQEATTIQEPSAE